MKRTAFDERHDQQVAGDYLANHGKCGFCASMVPNEDLARFGARCRGCYEAYCAEVNPSWWPNRPLTASERASVIRKATRKLQALGTAQPRAWANALRARAEAGERLSGAQDAAWREALRFEMAAAAPALYEVLP